MENETCVVVHKNDHGLQSGNEEEEIEFKMENCQSQEFLGFRLCGGRTAGVFINFIQPDSYADQVKRINIGDQVLRINATTVTGLTPEQVVRLLRSSLSATGRVLVSFSKLSSRKLIRPLQHQNGVLHSLSDTQLSTRHFSNVLSPQNLDLLEESPGMLPNYVDVHKSSRTHFYNPCTSSFLSDTEEEGSPDCPYPESENTNKIEKRTKENAHETEKDTVHFSPQKIFQYWNRHDSILNSRRVQFPDEYFHLSKPKSLYAEDFKALINSASKQNLRKEKILNEELPLVCFDQFNNMTPSPIEIERIRKDESNFSTFNEHVNDSKNTCYSLTNGGLTLSPETPTFLCYKL